MSFDPWTLAFQLLNFAVLLLVLFRLLFKPVREIMAKRAAQVQAALDAADKAHAEAEELRAGLALEQERVGTLRAEMLEKLQAEIEEHRQRRLAGVAAEAQSLLDRGRAVLESEQRKAGEELRERARRSVTDYAAALLADLADIEIHRALLRRLPAAFAGAGAELAGLNNPGEPVAVSRRERLRADGRGDGRAARPRREERPRRRPDRDRRAAPARGGAAAGRGPAL